MIPTASLVDVHFIFHSNTRVLFMLGGAARGGEGQGAREARQREALRKYGTTSLVVFGNAKRRSGLLAFWRDYVYISSFYPPSFLRRVVSVQFEALCGEFFFCYFRCVPACVGSDEGVAGERECRGQHAWLSGGENIT